MDIEANLREQVEVSANIMRIWDAASEHEPSLSPEQLEALSHHAYRLAELVQAASEWAEKQEPDTTPAINSVFISNVILRNIYDGDQTYVDVAEECATDIIAAISRSK